MRTGHLFGLDSLRGRIRFFALLLVSLPLAMAAFFFALFQRGQLLEAERAQLADLLQQDRQTVQAWIDGHVADTKYLSRLDSVRRGDAEAIENTFRNYVETHALVSAVVCLNAQGYTVVDTLAKPGVYGGDRQYFQEAQAGRAALVTGIVGRVSGKPLCIFSSPVSGKDGGFGGVVFMSVPLDSLDAWVREITAAPGEGVILCDAEGRILAPARAIAAAGAATPAKASSRLLGLSQAGELFTDDAGKEMLGASVAVGREGWRLILYRPVSEVLAGYRRQAMWVGLGTLCAIILLTPVVLRFCRNLERPLEQLTAYVLALRETGYADACPLLPPAHAPRELRVLFQAFRDMAARVRGHIDEAERASLQDVLTGLHNRRFLLAAGAKLLEKARRTGRPCACLMLDLDHFKNVNDTHGHTAGDLALRHLAQVVAGCARKSDLTARYGGEEFVVLAPDADASRALELAERIRRAVAENPCRLGGVLLPVTVSIGVSGARPGATDGEVQLRDLLARADKALYAAKAAGRDRVMLEEAGREGARGSDAS
ncbi:sensor domain-containing diguanylate cyclase [Solidesulfovibrio sp.]|uniref:sensor domain-containing diguanylate cyclase n=1 Tax=Solidesulfovibrio sp. TaxID=2910990 RepID=UPI0026053EC0|nr:sensor domain-containing diguanylate cyclase [Solidesulfovibrio sp.]